MTTKSEGGGCMNRWTLMTAVSICLLVISGWWSAALAVTEIKVALITPEGSTWTNALYQLAAEVERQTDGQVVFRVYAGGVSGDELDVLRKMRVNRIQAAASTTVIRKTRPSEDSGPMAISSLPTGHESSKSASASLSKMYQK